MSATANPVVSIVVPFLNAQRFLGEAVDAVLSQTFRDWELLLVDDGSSDASSNIARDYAARDPRITVLEHPNHENRGMSPSRNLGLSHARGEFVAPLDSDDVWEPRKLEEQVAVMRAHPEVALVFGSPLYWHSWDPHAKQSDFTPDLRIAADRCYGPRELAVLSYPLGEGSAPCPSDLLFRRSSLQTIGSWDEGFNGIYSMYEDQALLAKFYLRSAVYVSSRQWTRYRLHPDQFCANVTQDEYWKIRRRFLAWLKVYVATERIDDRRIDRAVKRAEAVARYRLLRLVLQAKNAFWRRPVRRLVSAILRPRTTSSKAC